VRADAGRFANSPAIVQRPSLQAVANSSEY
jgi:hypothetical protein